LIRVVFIVMVFLFLGLIHCTEKPKSANVVSDKTSIVKYPYKFKFEGNPLVRHHAAGDPDAHVWDGTMYVYCSQDHQKRPKDDGNYAVMDGYHVFSTTDMNNWIDHGEILHSRDVSWGVEGYMWAPGAARKDGKYYLYFPHKDKENNWRIGVAISDSPTGKFKDIGHPIEGIGGIDPMVFIDDDGQAYIYNNTAIVAKLKPNMIELAEKVQKIEYAPKELLKDEQLKFNEGSYMHKKDGIYYYSYTNWHNMVHQGFYAISDNPYGPFEWKGAMAPAQKGAQDHHSIVEFQEKWYYFYHIAGNGFKPKNWNGERRLTCFDRLYYNKDGTIKMVKQNY